jgi:penicillin-binding protein 1A
VGSLPTVEELRTYNPGQITRLYDINDRPFASFYLERREVIPLEKIPTRLRQAVVAVEDANFFSHRGIDPLGILRALLKNLMAGGIVQGGSTITQQVARAVFLSPEKTLIRKAKEAILAWRLERQFTKEEILWLYLNHIYFGQGAYGVEAAARTYFDKPAADLSLAECAMLAGLPKAPSSYSPTTHPEAARERMRLVLGRMVDEGYLTPVQREEALASPPVVQERQPQGGHDWFAEHVRRYLEREYGSDAIYRHGLRVYTTLDPRLQEAASRAVARGVRAVDRRLGYRYAKETVDLARAGALEEYIRSRKDWPRTLETEKTYPGVVVSLADPGRAVVRVGAQEGTLPLREMGWVYGEGGSRHPSRVDEVLRPGNVIAVRVIETGDQGRPLLALEQQPELEGALLCIDPRNGQVLAMVGGYDPTRSQFNRAIQSRRQPGSAFKPFIYAAAIERGSSPADVIVDTPIVFNNPDEESKIRKWKPENYDEVFKGPTRLREALNHSRNLPTIKLLQRVGMDPVLDLSSRLGIRSPLARDLSLALGSSGVTLLEMTSAYAALANGGVRTPPLFIRYLTDRRGTLLEVHQPQPVRAVDRETAFIITSMLQTVVEEGTGQRVRALGRPVAGKTGTTNDFLDAWFLGFIPQLVTGVWVGLNEEKPIGPGETGSRAAAPIWLEFMQEAVRGLPQEGFGIPPGVTFVRVDAESGLLASPRSPRAIFEVFRAGSEPTAMAHPEKRDATDFTRMELE